MGANGSGDAKEQLIVALDLPSPSAAMDMVDQLSDTCAWFKVGMELFYAGGRGMVEELVGRGFKVFLDLKVHDIPNTAAGAVQSLADTGASLLTIHAAGGARMMEAAAEASERAGGPRLLAVTVLTSTGAEELKSLGVFESPVEQVVRLARLAVSAGVVGMVCSSEETSDLRRVFGADPLLVIPGIRPIGTDSADQRRVATPSAALSNGASMLVVGRPITRAVDPAKAAQAILQEMAKVQREL